MDLAGAHSNHLVGGSMVPTSGCYRTYNHRLSLLGTYLSDYDRSAVSFPGQLVAMGQAISGLTAGVIPYIYGVLFLVVIMLVYEWMGGMKAVALADFVNGVVILAGVIGFLFLAWSNFGSLGDATEYLAATAPEKVGVPPPFRLRPTGSACMSWWE